MYDKRIAVRFSAYSQKGAGIFPLNIKAAAVDVIFLFIASATPFSSGVCGDDVSIRMLSAAQTWAMWEPGWMNSGALSQ